MIQNPRHPIPRLFSLFRRTEEHDKRPGHSYRQIAQGVLSAIGGRGITVIANFFAISLTYKYLGAERYGVWVTLSSILAYLTIFDLGIGSTAVNAVAEALAHKNLDSARHQISTVYLTLTAIAALAAVAVGLAWPFISWPAILGVRNAANGREITLAAALAVGIVLVNFPLLVTPRILGACQKITLSNIWTSCGSLLSLVAVIVATQLKTGLPGLVVALSGAALLVGLFSTLWLYRHFDWLWFSVREVQWNRVRGLLRTGLPFFAVQAAGIILFQTDNLIIAQLMGAQAVAPYSITWKLFSYASLLQVIAVPTLWPAYADAFARRDIGWINKTYRYNLLIAVSTTTVFVLVLMLIGRRFIAVWAGPSAVPSLGLIVGMAVWTIMASFAWCESCILGATGKVKGQAIYSAVGAIVNVFASIAFGRMFGLVGIIFGTLVAYTFCILVPQTIEVHQILSGKTLPHDQRTAK
jgi:O-antigen/teichoic acid export membrane protein